MRAVHWLVVMTRRTYVKRAALQRAVALGLDRVEARLERDGMVHERDEREAPRLVGEQPIEPGQREAVDDDDAAVREAGERRARRAQRRGRRRREARVERVHGDAPAALRQAGDDLAVVDVAARRRLNVAGHDEVDACVRV